MINAKLWIRRMGIAATATALVLNLSAAHALVINATTTFDNDTTAEPSFSFGPTSGSFSLTSGGTTTSATYVGDTATPTNVLSDSLPDVFDGTGFNGTASANFEEFAIGFDTIITIENDTGIADTVKIRLDYSNMVNADGPDAFAHSNLFLFDNITPGDLFFSDLKSDTLNGDENGGVLTGGSGDVLMESGVMIFDYTIGAGDLVELTMSWTLEGGEFNGSLDPLDVAEASLSANLTIVPLPGSLLFMVSGMLFLPLQRLLRKK